MQHTGATQQLKIREAALAVMQQEWNTELCYLPCFYILIEWEEPAKALFLWERVQLSFSSLLQTGRKGKLNFTTP